MKQKKTQTSSKKFNKVVVGDFYINAMNNLVETNGSKNLKEFQI